MVEQLKKFYDEHNITCNSPFGEYSYRLMTINLWLRGGAIINIVEELNNNDIYGIILMNQETQKKLIVEYDNVDKMKILKRQIKFYMKDKNTLSIKY